MRLIIAGGRNYQFTAEDIAKLDAIAAETTVTEVVCGGANGADECGRQWAIANGVAVKMFPADWNTHGRAAGPIRNEQMAQYGDAVALFPGGRGTDSMHRYAVANGLKVFDFR
ncbi:MAG: SLOG family protein [Planctomycetota bacterium]